MVAFVEREQVEACTTHAAQSYQSVTSIEPKVCPVQAAQGTGALDDTI
jgi:galactokinase